MGQMLLGDVVKYTTDAVGNSNILKTQKDDLNLIPFKNSLQTDMPTSVEVRGDSFVFGTGLTDLTKKIGSVLAASLGTSLINSANPGTGVTTVWLTCINPPNSVSPQQISNRVNYLVIGLNDCSSVVASNLSISAFTGILASVVALLASNYSAWRSYYNGGPGGNYYGAPAGSFSFTTSGGISSYGGAPYWAGVTSVTNGETCTQTVQGDVIYIIYDRFKTLTGGTFSVTIDGVVVVPTVACSGAGLILQPGDQAICDSPTAGFPTLLRVPTTAGRHTVIITVTSGTGANNKVQIEAVAGNTDIIGSRSMMVVLSAIPRLNSAGYAGLSPAKTLANGQADTALYSAAIKSVADMFYADGLNVSYADLDSFYDPTNIPTQIQADNIHPTALGAAAIASALVAGSGMRTIRQRRNYASPTVAYTVGASPFIYRNNTSYDVDIIVTGGTVSDVSFSRDGITYLTIATATGAQIFLSPYDYVKITYTVVPIMTIISR